MMRVLIRQREEALTALANCIADLEMLKVELAAAKSVKQSSDESPSHAVQDIGN